MAILHRNITNSSDIHNPKWFPDSNNGDYAFKNEKGELESTDELLLPAALNFVDGSVAPPTTATGDIYILSSGASVNAGWGSVSLQDWVRYDGTAWNSLTPQKSTLCYDKTADSLMSFDGSAWNAIGGGGGASTIYTSDDSLTGNRTVDLDGNNLLFNNQAGDNILKIQDNEIFTLGKGASSSYSTAVAVGRQSNASGDSSVAIGNNSASSGTASIAIGNSSNITSIQSVAIGSVATSTGTNGIAIGQNSSVVAKSVGIGANTETNANSQALGHTAKSLGAYSVAIGYVAKASSTNSITIGGRSCITSGSRSITMSTSNASINNTVGESFLVNLNNATNALFIGQTTDSYYGGSGNFGIGTTTPSGKLTVEGADTLSTSSALQVYDGDSTPNLLMTVKNNGTINFSSLPTSSAGLSSGDVYNDSGTLKIV
tara:strand:- start:6227 stop:7516 length:1290 start_codon:yes stop_codon:yes gene_type:complete